MVEKLKKLYDEVLRELKKVSWPEQEQVLNSSFVVIVITAIFTLFIYGADLLFSYLLNWLY